jgi:UDP-N-acetylglucosamine--N-acetylmuramyl-(pentapeptide) pyrophosphoryl-undecaprenol N-acetylglucosamine transferase
VRVPSVLVPFPAATDNHQFFNARAFEETGAAKLFEQKSLTPETLAQKIAELVSNSAAREKAQSALAKWHVANAAEQIAEIMLAEIVAEKERVAKLGSGHSCCSCGCDHNARTAKAA